MKRMKARAYLRVSTEEQATEGFSLAAQQERCRQFIKSQGWHYDGEYIDDGYSAKNLNRPAMQRLIKDVKAKAFDILVVYRLDRLVRSVPDLHYLIQLFDSNDVKFRSVTEVFDTTSAMGRFFITLVSAMAQWERENLAERVRMGMERRAAEGKRNGATVPYGYRLEGDRLVIDPEEADLVRRIFRLYRQHGMDAIANMLNAEGLKTRRGNNWDPNVIKYMLSNPIYVGRVEWGRKSNKMESIAVDGAAPAIISEEDFEEAQRIMKKRRSMPARGKSDTSDYIFAGILSCGYCGRKLYGTNRRGTYYYCCTNRYKNWKNCPMPRVNERAVIQAVFQVIDFVADYDEIEPAQEEKQDVAIRRQELEKQLEAIKKRRKKRLMAFEDGIITLEELRERNREDAEKEKEILRELEELNAADQGPSLDKETFLAYVQDLRQLWPQLERKEQKKLIQTIFRDIVIVEAPNQPKYPGRHGLKKVNIVDYVLNT